MASFDGPIVTSFIFSEESGVLYLHSSIEIINILSLDEAQSSMTIQLKLTVEWIDSRLEFVNLKNKQEMNTLTPEELDQIWMPTLVFSNTQNKQLAYFRNNSITTVQPNEGKSGSNHKFFYIMSMVITNFLTFIVNN